MRGTGGLVCYGAGVLRRASSAQERRLWLVCEGHRKLGPWDSGCVESSPLAPARMKEWLTPWLPRGRLALEAARADTVARRNAGGPGWSFCSAQGYSVNQVRRTPCCGERYRWMNRNLADLCDWRTPRTILLAPLTVMPCRPWTGFGEQPRDC